MILTLLAVIFAGSINAAVVENKKEIVGEWKYEAPTAPYGYDKGVFVLEEKEGELVGYVKLADGYKIDLKNVSYEKKEFKCGLYVDYEYVSLKTKIEGKKMEGTVDTPEGEMKIIATKVK